VYVWTKKAEQHYRRRHPHRKNEWKEGTEALWENKPLNRTIVEGYAERGWICEVVNNVVKPVPVKKEKSAGSVDGHCLTKEECRKRWRKLVKLFGAPNKYSLYDIALEIGLKSDSAVSGFVYKYGVELSKKYGKLPYKEGLRMPIWAKVMEAKA
jgi:hypothetical protein